MDIMLAGLRALFSGGRIPTPRRLADNTGSRDSMGRQTNGEPYRWLSIPRWYLWEGGFLLTARAQGVVPSHAHHAIQIVIALDGRVAICGHADEWHESRGIVVRPDVEHSFDCN